MEFLSEEQLTEARTLRKRFDAESESDRLLPPACSTRPVEDTEEET